MNLTENQLRFLKSFGEGKKIEINNLSEIVREIKQTENIYFCAGGSSSKRNSDKDITEKNYFVIDLDIRKHIEKEYEGDKKARNPRITDEEIKEIGESFMNFTLKRGGQWSEWRFIVFSGNGLHIYYQGDKIEKPDPILYKMGVSSIFSDFEKVFGGAYMTPDPVCCNLARIMRLPDTTNQKTGKKCEILYEQDIKSSLVAQIIQRGEEEKDRIKKNREKENEEAKRIYEIQSRLCKLSGEAKTDIEGFLKKKEMIDQIPIHLVSQIILPQFRLSHNERNFDNEKGGYTAFFISGKHDNTICNGGSRHYNFGGPDSCYTPSVLVKKQFDLTWGETLQWFSKNFSNLSKNG